MTPTNSLGYQMAPSKEEAEEALRELGERGAKIIVINILASGTVTLEEACKYLESFKDKMYVAAYGLQKPHRARGNATVFKQCFCMA